MQIFITIDTELWPFMPGWPDRKLPADKVDFTPEIDAYIYGKTAKGDFGLPYQLALFKQHGLKATFFVEPFCAHCVGMPALKNWVGMISSASQEIGLHPHTEWLSEVRLSCLDTGHRQFIHNYSEDEQACIIQEGLSLLEAAGASRLTAFRAGGYGANTNTLRALARNGLSIDSSYNPAVPWSFPDENDLPPHGPTQTEGVWEVPISQFIDYPSHLRHAQLCAASFPELREAIIQADRSGMPAFVIVLHSGELVNKKRLKNGMMEITPAWVVIRRLEKLCGFLSEYRSRFSTAHFSELPLEPRHSIAALPHPKTGMGRAALRMAEQIVARLI